MSSSVREVHGRCRSLLRGSSALTRYVYAVPSRSAWKVAHAARHVDCLGRVEAGGTPGRSFAQAQVDPPPTRAGRDADRTCPTARRGCRAYALFALNEMLFLHRPEIGQAQRGHLRALPVLLEPAAVVAVHRQVEHDQAGMFVLSTFSSFSKP